MRRTLFGWLTFLFLTSVAVRGQGQPGQVFPVPIPGGDVFVPPVVAPPGYLINQFFPRVGAPSNGQDEEPHGITNFKGHVAMGYTLGTAIDNAGKQYAVITDIRVYQ